MQTKALGDTGVQVSALALGTMQMGNATPEDDSARILDRHFEAGGSFLDTADCYERWAFPGSEGGQREEVLGRWMCAQNGRPAPVAVQQQHTYLRPAGDSVSTVDGAQLDYRREHDDLTLVAYSPIAKGSYDRPGRPLSPAHAGDEARLENLLPALELKLTGDQLDRL
jgi:hypothetical protein